MRYALHVVLLCFFTSVSAETDQEAAARVAQDYGCMIEDAVWTMGACEAPSYFGGKMLTESTGDPNAVSKAGAVGLMQMKPSTLKFVQRHFPEYNLTNDLRDPRNNIRASVAYHCYIKYEHKDGIPYDDAAEVSMGYLYGHNGGEKHTDKAYSHPYFKQIEYWQSLLPTMMCRA